MTEQDLDGATVYDADGETVGKVDRTYTGADGVAQYARVKIGTLLAKYRLVPLDRAEETEDGLKVPYTKDLIENSLDLPEDADPRGGMVGEDLRGYYATSSSVQENRAGEDRGLAARPVNTESSEATVEQAPAAAVHENPSGEANQGQEIGAVRDAGDVIEIPVVEERLVKQPVVTEVIRVKKTTTGEQRTIATDVQKEDIQPTPEGDAVIRDVSEDG